MSRDELIAAIVKNDPRHDPDYLRKHIDIDDLRKAYAAQISRQKRTSKKARAR